MIAKVIVDVPSRQTDRPFDYIVPYHLQEWVEVGSRVGVPFGGRVLQGFVIQLQEESRLDQHKLKEIAELLDAAPPLLPDLIELASWMSHKYCCSHTQALQAMIPAALKGKEERFISINDDESDEWKSRVSAPLLHWLEQHSPKANWTVMMEQFPDEAAEIRKLIKDNKLQLQSYIKDKLAVKKVQAVYMPMQVQQQPFDALLDQLAKTALKQKEVLQYMYEQPQEQTIPIVNVTKELECATSTVRALVEKELLIQIDLEQQRDPYAGRHFKTTEPLLLTEEQQLVFEQIAITLDKQQPYTFLLQGVTGSGKTEVYLQSIDRCLKDGRQAIVLVPEISLTPQMVERFKGRFGDQVAVMHSRLSGGERYDEWRRIRNGESMVAIGARSAIFAPFQQLGLIIIDEEHESSYKQEESPKYHTRDVAVRRAMMHGATVILGSATPSLESYVAASMSNPKGKLSEDKRAALLSMTKRVNDRALPEVTVIDMKEELLANNRSMFSRRLHEALQERLQKGEQSVLLLNRRGFATFIMCRSCSYTMMCPHCDIALTYHQKSQVVRCHYCGYAEQTPTVCPACTSEHIRFFGTGTQKVEAELAKLFPGIRVIRMDVDTTSGKNAHEQLLKQFESRKADVLLGTQMVAKGLDFPYVTLVGVIAADTSLHLPDFRAAERTFQLLTQVAGRAGRHHLPGEVIIQSYTPEHYAIVTSQQHDYETFVQQELQHRRMLGYPPYCRLAVVTMSHDQLPLLSQVSHQFVEDLRQLADHEGVLVPLSSGFPRSLEVLGPVASPIAKMKDRYRFQCVLKYRGSIDIAALIQGTLHQYKEKSIQKKIQYSIDIDPQVIM
ncbi:primosomal protein N' [Paenibacillus yanchengensis]|uniref:Replication restart protein PriA n=1 Tax=Paenibacillus yanchengensis TaxID=2035833 RepID=A0ABW4YMJ6_9BACL